MSNCFYQLTHCVTAVMLIVLMVSFVYVAICICVLYIKTHEADNYVCISSYVAVCYKFFIFAYHVLLEPIDDIKVQVQINTITMKQIKDMLIKDSTEAMERDEKIIKLIEDLRNDMMINKSIPEFSTSQQSPITAKSNAPFMFKVQFKGANTLRSQTWNNSYIPHITSISYNFILNITLETYIIYITFD